MEAAGLHGCPGFGILHEGVPDKGCAKIFCHEHADSQIDTEDVGVVPVEFGVEGSRRSRSVPMRPCRSFLSERAENLNAVAGKEG